LVPSCGVVPRESCDAAPLVEPTAGFSIDPGHEFARAAVPAAAQRSMNGIRKMEREWNPQ